MSSTLQIKDWDVSAVKFMAPKINDKGGKSINIISTQTHRTLSISSPLMMSWGIADFVDEKGDSNGKYSISLNFPNDENTTVGTNTFLDKIKKFEDNFIDEAVKHSEEWFGEKMSREVVKHMYFPILKYSKNKDTKKIDYTKPPSIRAKVTNYGGKWNVEIYDVKMKMIFPDTSNLDLTPIDFVPKLSQVACMLSIANVWIGGKGLGITLKLTQCIVKPKESIISTVGKCQIQLSSEDLEIFEQCDTESESKTQVEDSDDEGEVTRKLEPIISVPDVIAKVVLVSDTIDPVISKVVSVSDTIDPVDELISKVEKLSVSDTIDPVDELISKVEKLSVSDVAEPVIVKKKIVKKKVV